jgi:hypothetical protein
VRDTKGWQIQFSWIFGLAKRVEWDSLYRIFDLHPFGEGIDEVSWSLEASGDFQLGLSMEDYRKWQ